MGSLATKFMASLGREEIVEWVLCKHCLGEGTDGNVSSATGDLSGTGDCSGGPRLECAGVRAANSNSKFCRDLWKVMAGKKYDNLAVSPLGISLMMGALIEGASGDTYQQIREAMYFEHDDLRRAGHWMYLASLEEVKDPIISVASRIFVSNKISTLPDFTDSLRSHYGSTALSVDFSDSKSAARKINTWSATETRGLIDNIIEAQEIGPNTSLVLANSIFFQGTWATRFDPKETETKEFYSPTGPKDVPMMQLESKFYYSAMPRMNYTMLEMPYQASRFAMQFLLPKRITSQQELLEGFKERYLEDTFRASRAFTKVHVEMPRFKVSNRLALTSTLSELGLVDMFGDRADFTKACDNAPLFVSKVQQNTVVAVTEEGCKAAAVTSTIMVAKCAGLSRAPSMAYFVMDRPFLFRIVDRCSRMIFFQGAVTDPSLSD